MGPANNYQVISKPVPATTTVVDPTDFAKDNGCLRGAPSGVVGVEAGRGGEEGLSTHSR